MNIEKKKFKVGDIVTIKNIFCKNTYVIERITKTCAVSSNIKFKIDYGILDDGRFLVNRIPKIKWDTNEYEVKST